LFSGFVFLFGIGKSSDVELAPTGAVQPV
jgi:hypothetical protein